MSYDEDYFGSTPLNGLPFWRPHPLMNVPPREFTPRRRQPNARSVAIQRAKKATAKKSKSPPRKSTAKWTKGRKLAQKKCAPDSYRVFKPNAKTLITRCCPPTEWMPRKKKCKVPLRPHLKRVPKKR